MLYKKEGRQILKNTHFFLLTRVGLKPTTFRTGI